MAKHTLIHAFQEFINRHHLIVRGEKIIVSLSGGIDSVVLFDLMCELKKYLMLEISAAHINHQLRGSESDADETFVTKLSRDKGVKCFVESVDTKHHAEIEKLSIQEAARNLRYTFLDKLRSSLGYDKIATAHNADDNTETIILNLLRGTGVHGMTGIPVFRKDHQIIRPLLFATRQRIIEHATKCNIQYREDSSNLKSDYTRNYLRLKVIPLLRENVNPNLTATIGKSSELFSQLEEYLDSLYKRIAKKVILKKTVEEIILSITVIEAQPLFIQEHVLYKIGKDFISSEIDFSTVKGMIGLIKAESGSMCSISKDTILFRDRNNLIFRRKPTTTSYLHDIQLNHKNTFDSFTIECSRVATAKYSNDPNVEFIDADNLKGKLIVRSWHEGDWFIPLGMSDKKKLSDFFIDQKIPLFEKHIVPILCSGSDIVWICGRRLDNRFKITPKTTNILKLEFRQRLINDK